MKIVATIASGPRNENKRMFQGNTDGKVFKIALRLNLINLGVSFYLPTIRHPVRCEQKLSNYINDVIIGLLI